MAQLVSKQEFISATNLRQFRLAGAAGPLMRVTGIAKMNRLYEEMQDLEGGAFIDHLFQRLEVDINVEGNGWDNIPKHGPFITISNHPFGLWDGLALMKVIGEVRPDFKIMAHFLLEQIPQIKAYTFAVNHLEFEGHSSLGGMKQSLQHLDSGHPLGLFPAGEVSHFHPQKRQVADRAWQKPAIKLIQKMGVPVVPVYFEGNNSVLFQVMGLIHPALRTAAIPSEMLRRKRSQLRMNIGKPIAPREFKHIQNADRLGRYLRARTYSLGSGLEVNPFFAAQTATPNQHRPIAQAIAPERLAREIDRLPKDTFMMSQQEFDVFCASPQQIPLVLQEIGRLRELSFRAVGEGTGKAFDLDEYDLYYRHLFLWDREARQIAGAYRVGMGAEIMERYGKKGFYTHSLFRMKGKFGEVLGKSMELGRSFVETSYQKKRLPLFLLWKGIIACLHRHQGYQYLLGPVTISNAYSSLSKHFIVSLIRKSFYDPELAGFIKARKRFRPKKSKVEMKELVDGIENDLRLADKLIDQMDSKHAHLPILLKKYIKQNARIIGFNIDPLFSDCLDGLMILHIQDLPSESIATR